MFMNDPTGSRFCQQNAIVPFLSSHCKAVRDIRLGFAALYAAHPRAKELMSGRKPFPKHPWRRDALIPLAPQGHGASIYGPVWASICFCEISFDALIPLAPWGHGASINGPVRTSICFCEISFEEPLFPITMAFLSELWP
jgi:hypothetical protein